MDKTLNRHTFKYFLLKELEGVANSISQNITLLSGDPLYETNLSEFVVSTISNTAPKYSFNAAYLEKLSSDLHSELAEKIPKLIQQEKITSLQRENEILKQELENARKSAENNEKRALLANETAAAATEHLRLSRESNERLKQDYNREIKVNREYHSSVTRKLAHLQRKLKEHEDLKARPPINDPPVEHKTSVVDRRLNFETTVEECTSHWANTDNLLAFRQSTSTKPMLTFEQAKSDKIVSIAPVKIGKNSKTK